jgi:hypothetical protein
MRIKAKKPRRLGGVEPGGNYFPTQKFSFLFRDIHLDRTFTIRINFAGVSHPPLEQPEFQFSRSERYAPRKPAENVRPAIPAQNPNQPRLWLACACQDVLCACKGFFIIVIHRYFSWFFCPQTGQILRTQNLKSKPQRRAALSSQTAAVARNGLTALAARPLFLCAFSWHLFL